MDGGKLIIRLELADGRITGVNARSTRPAAARVLAGKPVDQALKLIPLFFSLCGQAQAAVGAAAVAAAEGRRVATADLLPVHLEAAQEHLWRLLLDWPQALGLPPRAPAFANWHKRLAAARRAGDSADPRLADDLEAFLATEIFGGAAADWAARDDDDAPDRGLAGQLLAALAAVEPPVPDARAPSLLPRLEASAWVALFADAGADFVRHPTWRGSAAETGALARHAGHPRVARRIGAGALPAARLFARLLDLAAIPAQLAGRQSPVDACSPAPGCGVASLDTARGQLVHSVRLRADGATASIADYAVLAPTEWNFHPRGNSLNAIVGRPVADAADAAARLQRLILALDPCVPCSTEISNA